MAGSTRGADARQNHRQGLTQGQEGECLAGQRDGAGPEADERERHRER